MFYLPEFESLIFLGSDYLEFRKPYQNLIVWLQGSHTTGKTGKVREIEYCAPGPGKILKLDKCGQSPGKVREKETGAVPHF